MASRIEYRVEFPHPMAEVLAASSDEDVLRERLTQLGGSSAALLEHGPIEGGVRFTLRQGISAEQLPPAVQAFHKGDLIVQREQTWIKSDRGYTGTAKATVSGVPGEIIARNELTEENGQAVLTSHGSVTVRIPFFGGRLETVIAEQVTVLLRREADFTAKWLADHA